MCIIVINSYGYPIHITTNNNRVRMYCSENNGVVECHFDNISDAIEMLKTAYDKKAKHDCDIPVKQYASKKLKGSIYFESNYILIDDIPILIAQLELLISKDFEDIKRMITTNEIKSKDIKTLISIYNGIKTRKEIRDVKTSSSKKK